MIWLLAISALGLPAGFLLMTRVPLCKSGQARSNSSVSLVIPARNEERNLPQLLQSIRNEPVSPCEVLVIDDCSTDATAAVAELFGALVIPSPPLPPGWTGKTWACAQGSAVAQGELLLFLDADTWFAAGGYQRLLTTYEGLREQHCALSLLPYHVTRKPYEELSLFFNLLTAFGAGGFGVFGGVRLFGQSLLLSRLLYVTSGGHESVKHRILENLAMAAPIAEAGGRCVCLGGRGTLNIRMFPAGFAQLCEGWTKAFADGASASNGIVLGISIYWLTALSLDVIMLLNANARSAASLLYLLFVIQIFWFSRQIGLYRLLTSAFYPLPLLFFFLLFARSLLRKALKRQVTWRGRQL